MKRRTSRTLRRRGAKRRRSVYRARLTRFPRVALRNQVTLKRTYYSGIWTVSNTTTSDFWKYFEPTLSNGFNNPAEFTGVFDQYRINGITVTFRPRFDNVAAPVTGSTPMTMLKPYLCTIVDPQSTLTPTGVYSPSTLNVLLENGGKIRSATRPLSVWYKPMVQIPTNIGSGVMYVKSPWLRSVDTATPHRGFHAHFFEQSFGTNFTDLSFDVYVTMNVTFKDVK